MNGVNIVFIAIVVLTVVLACGAILWYREKTKATINRISEMLDSAISGNFQETIYDESAISSLEAKLNRYLSSALASEKNLTLEKDRIKSLISDISHQTKTPLSNILLYGQLLSEWDDLPGECAEMVRQINMQAEKLRFLVDALVKTSRMEAGIITVSPKQDSVEELLSFVLDEISPKAKQKNITLRIVTSQLRAYFDKKWTSEAFYNILDNAVKYTPEHGIIAISVTAYELFCRIDISDSGVGIDVEELNRIFQRFYRSPSVNQHEGVGIGLFLARKIISAQGGYIKVKSELGKGSTFSVFLPKEK